MTGSCCPQVHHFHLSSLSSFGSSIGKEDTLPEEGGRVVGGAFGVALALGGGVLALCEIGLAYLRWSE